jgi:hypothetical protein
VRFHYPAVTVEDDFGETPSASSKQFGVSR